MFFFYIDIFYCITSFLLLKRFFTLEVFVFALEENIFFFLGN